LVKKELSQFILIFSMMKMFYHLFCRITMFWKHSRSRSIIYSSPRSTGRGHNHISVCNWFRVLVWFRWWFNNLSRQW